MNDVAIRVTDMKSFFHVESDCQLIEKSSIPIVKNFGLFFIPHPRCMANGFSPVKQTIEIKIRVFISK